jgi:hypothetical protein
MLKINYLYAVIVIFLASSVHAQQAVRSEAAVATSVSPAMTTAHNPAVQPSVKAAQPLPPRKLNSDEVFLSSASSDPSVKPTGVITKVIRQYPVTVIANPKPLKMQEMTVTSASSSKSQILEGKK